MKSGSVLQYASLLFAGWIVILASCKKSAEPVTLTGFTQGTTFVVRYFGAADSVIIEQGIDSIFKIVNETASLYDSNSMISKVNRDEPVDLNDMFIHLFNRSMEISDETGGAFDITVGQLVRGWGFYRKNKLEVDSSKIDSLRNLTGYRLVHIDKGRLVKPGPGLMIDFNAIAQGYTVDLIAHLLEKNGIHNYLAEIGGEVRTAGMKPGNEPWVVGIERPAPNDSAEQEVGQKIGLSGQSAATSGNSRKFFIRDGVKYAHTIDPQTGYPVHHSLLSVTVIAGDCMTADAYATACMVMGKERAVEFILQHPGTEAYFIYSAPSGENAVYYTRGFKKYLLEK